jgi:hypothetical protein
LTRSHALEVFHSIDELTIRFREPRGSLAVMIFIAGSRLDLVDLHSIKELFFDLPMILVFPDRNKETARLGFKLYPRFVTYCDGDFEDVKGVLGNMLKKVEKRGIWKRERTPQMSLETTGANKGNDSFLQVKTTLGFCV